MGAILLSAPIVVHAAEPLSDRTLGLLDAVQQALKLQPELAIEKESVQISKGTLQSAASGFDARFQATTSFTKEQTTNTSEFPEMESDTSTFSIGLVKKFRSGIEVIPEVELSKTSFPAEPDTESLSQARVQFKVRIPLLKGFGERNVAVNEIAASHELAASKSDLLHQCSVAVRDTSLAYWSFLSYFKQLEIYQQSEQRSRLLENQTRALIQAEQLPASDLQNVLANLADKESLRIAAEQNLIESRYQLGLFIGLNAKDAFDLPLPHNDFPTLSQPDSVTILSNSPFYLSLFESNRYDLLALSQRGQGRYARLQAMKNLLQPSLNVDAMAGYDGFSSGGQQSRLLDSFHYRQQGLDWSLGLRLEYPLGNRSAKGDSAQILASYRQNQIQINNLKRIIATKVMADISNLHHLSAERLKADTAVNSYQQAVENERQRFLMGESTLLNLLDVQDRLDSAMLKQISTRYRLAQAVTELRYETGTLVDRGADQLSVELHTLVTIPKVAASNP